MEKEKRLIDANVVLAKQFTAGLSDASGNYYGHADVVFVNDIENAPTIDAVEVVHGRWLSEMHGNSNNGTCSACGSYEHAYAFGWNYCPDCGAKMDE